MHSQDHHKHPKLARPKLGNFGRNEWAILGAPCGVIQTLARQVITHLARQYECAYVDANHVASDETAQVPGMLASGATIEYTDAITHRQLNASTPWGVHQYRSIFNDCDVILVNGNHHVATAQIVIIDPVKAASLKRRLGQLTNVQLILLQDDNTEVYDFLEQAVPDIGQIPTLLLRDTAGILQFFEREMKKNTPLLNGLVLAGGQSVRMGRDKGAIEWHGKPQREYLVDLLRPVCSDVLISCRPEQQQDFRADIPTLPDAFIGLGPFGAVLSGFKAQPDRAWLVVACDLPLLDRGTIDFLVAARCIRTLATAFKSPFDALPEPLITIWEPKAYAVLLSFLAQGYSCPRKVLIHSNAQILTAPNPETLQNVNTPEDMERMQNHALWQSFQKPQQ